MPTLRSAMRTFLEDWKSDVARPWRQFLSDVEPAYDKIDESLDLDEDEVIFPGRKGAEPEDAPARSHVFRALDGISPNKVRAIVVGQDPHPKVSRATGRAFEQGDLTSWTSGGVALSLKRIIRCAAQYRSGSSRYVEKSGWGQIVEDLESGSLDLRAPRATFDSWQRQGVLFLNTGLTLTRYKPGGHPHQLRGHLKLWAPVVGAICRRLAQREGTPVIFLSWGSKARHFLSKVGVLRSSRHPLTIAPGLASTAVVDRDHPAVASFTNAPNVFTETNQKLKAMGADPIDW